MPKAEAETGLRQVATGPTKATETERRLPAGLTRAVPRNATVATYRGRRAIAGPTTTDVRRPATATVRQGTPVAVLEVAVLVIDLTGPIAARVAAVARGPVPVVPVEGKTPQAVQAIEGLQGVPVARTAHPVVAIPEGQVPTEAAIEEVATTTTPFLLAATIVDATQAEAILALGALTVLAEAVAGPARVIPQAVVPRPIVAEAAAPGAGATAATLGEGLVAPPAYGRPRLVDALADEAANAATLVAGALPEGVPTRLVGPTLGPLLADTRPATTHVPSRASPTLAVGHSLPPRCDTVKGRVSANVTPGKSEPKELGPRDPRCAHTLTYWFWSMYDDFLVRIPIVIWRPSAAARPTATALTAALGYMRAECPLPVGVCLTTPT